MSDHMIDSEMITAGAIRQSMDSAERCKCGANPTVRSTRMPYVKYTRRWECGTVAYDDGPMFHSARCLRRQLAQRPRLNDLAAECHELAMRRGKYADGERGAWGPLDGYMAVRNEAREWETEAGVYDVSRRSDARDREIAEMGDLLHAVLSIAHHRGIDVEAALRDAMQRNRERAGRGE